MQNQNIRIWWLRESVRGTPHVDLGREVSPAELRYMLSGSEQNRNIAAFAESMLFLAGRTGCRNIVLPDLDCKEWARRQRRFQSIIYDQHEGMLVPGANATHRAETVARLSAGAHFTAKFELDAITAWARVPSEKRPAYRRVFAAVSTEIQALLRRKIPAMLLSREESLFDPDFVMPLLVYQLSKPFESRTRTEYNYDFLDEDTLRGVAWAVRGEFRRALYPVYWKALEISSRLASAYSPDRIACKLRRVGTEAKLLSSLLAIDYAIVEHAIRFAAFREEIVSVRTARLAAHRYVGGIATELRRGYAGVDLSSITPQVVACANHALEAALAREAAPGLPQPHPAESMIRLIA
jgi:hypothetical protein